MTKEHGIIDEVHVDSLVGCSDVAVGLSLNSIHSAKLCFELPVSPELVKPG